MHSAFDCSLLEPLQGHFGVIEAVLTPLDSSLAHRPQYETQGKTVLHTVSWRSHTYTIFSFYRALMHWVDSTVNQVILQRSFRPSAGCSQPPALPSMELPLLLFQQGGSCLPLLATKPHSWYMPKNGAVSKNWGCKLPAHSLICFIMGLLECSLCFSEMRKLKLNPFMPEDRCTLYAAPFEKKKPKVCCYSCSVDFKQSLLQVHILHVLKHGVFPFLIK